MKHSNYWSSLHAGEQPSLEWCELRDYQADCLYAIHRASQEGVRRMLIALPTGTGKSRIFSHLPHALPIEKRLLVLAHRRELIKQAVEHLQEFNPTRRIGIEYGESHASPDDDIIVASLNGLKHSSARRLNRLNPESISHIVYDECHHAAARDTVAFLRRIHVFVRRDLHLIGFTATPFRTDGLQLEAIFERKVYQRTLEEMITAGWLAPIRAYRIQSQVDISQVQITRGDFDDRQLERTINTPERNALVLDAYRHKGLGYGCIVFCAGVHHANTIAHGFEAAGYSAACIHGKLQKERRDELIEAFQRGEIKVLTNYNVLTEGFDAPATRLMIMARPTTSGIVLAQAVGRVTRLHKESGKTHATVIEIADVNPNAKTVGVGSLFKLNPQFNAQGADLLKAKAAADAVRKLNPDKVDPTKFETATQVQQALDQTRRRRRATKKAKASPTRSSAGPRTEKPALPELGGGPPRPRPLVERPPDPADDYDDTLEELDGLFEELTLSMTPQDLFDLVNAKPPRWTTRGKRSDPGPDLLPVPFGEALSEEEFQSRLEDSDLLTKLTHPRAADQTVFTWMQTGTSQLSITFRDRRRLEITQDLVGQHQVTRHTPDPRHPLHETIETMGVYPSRSAAIAAAETWIRKNLPFNELTLYHRNAAWRKKPMSEKQRSILEYWRIPYEPHLTSGEAYDLIHQHRQQRQGLG